MANPVEAVATLKARDGLLNLEIECKRLLVALNLSATPNYIKEGLSSVDSGRLTQSIAEMRRVFDFKDDIPIDSVYTSKFLPAKEDRIPPALGKCNS
jgi:NitT/TauT family transport system substrate-binding protein